MTPEISIITPVYNRSGLIARALHSCLRQSFERWEVIVIDDASTDNSVEVVRAFSDSRIRLLQHGDNVGHCIARNHGADVATGEWLFFLDSDDELPEGALQLVSDRAKQLPPDVSRMFFAVQMDDGSISPNPPFDGTRIDYERFVRWLERMHAHPTETLSVVRRKAFLEIPYPNWRTHEGGHNLDFVKRFDCVGFADVARLYHFDATNRMTDDARALQSLLQAAPGLARMGESVLASHGRALREWAPTKYWEYLHYAGLYNLLSRRRARGAALVARAWLQRPFKLKTAALLVLFFAPVSTIARFKMWYSA